MSRGSRVVGYELALSEEWSVVPAELPDVEEWAEQEAARMIARSGRAVEPVDTSSLPFAQEADGGTVIDVRELLARQLVSIVGAIREMGLGGVRGLVLAQRPDVGGVDALATVAVHAGVAPEVYAREIEDTVRESEDQDYLFTQMIDTEVTGSRVCGAHMLLGHVDPTLGYEVAHLEERVTLGVFPEGSPDMVEVTAIASSVGVFDDMPQTMIDLVADFEITLEAAA